RRPSQPLKSPTTATPLAFGAHTAKRVPPTCAWPASRTSGSVGGTGCAPIRASLLSGVMTVPPIPDYRPVFGSWLVPFLNRGLFAKQAQARVQQAGKRNHDPFFPMCQFIVNLVGGLFQQRQLQRQMILVGCRRLGSGTCGIVPGACGRIAALPLITIRAQKCLRRLVAELLQQMVALPLHGSGCRCPCRLVLRVGG